MGRIRKRTIYIDTDLDKEFAKAAIDAEVTYSSSRFNQVTFTELEEKEEFKSYNFLTVWRQPIPTKTVAVACLDHIQNSCSFVFH